MKIGEIVKIRNSAGILEVKLTKQLNFAEISKGIGECKLPTLEKPRLEYHRKDDDEFLITLYDNSQQLQPAEIYILHIISSEKILECFLGEFDESEHKEDVYQTQYD